MERLRNSNMNIVTTVVGHLNLGVGDMVRVVHGTDDMAWCAFDDRFAWIPRAHLYPLHVPILLNPGSPHIRMESFLTKTSQLTPDEGWSSYIHASGVSSVFKPPRSWQFGASGWGEQSGKTGGLHICLNPDGSRRCQLSVENGICGDSLINTIQGSKAGVLMYLPNMKPESTGNEHETSLTLAFSAILIAYIETMSIVRKEVFRATHHPHGGKLYPNIEWDFTHLPFSKPWMVFASRSRYINLGEFAKARAVVWLQAERAASPDAWKDGVPRNVGLTVGERVQLRMQAPGVANWVEAVVTDTAGPTFSVTVPPHTLCRTDASMFFV